MGVAVIYNITAPATPTTPTQTGLGNRLPLGVAGDLILLSPRAPNPPSDFSDEGLREKNKKKNIFFYFENSEKKLFEE